MIHDLKHFVQVANGLEKAQFVLKNAMVYNSFTGKFFPGDIAIEEGYIAGVGKYDGEKEVDVGRRYALPGLIDGHIHIESSMMSPAEFTRTVLPLGTTTIINDPHEIANVAGVEAIRYMIAAARTLPMNIYFTLPSCVPSTSVETAGAVLGAEELLPLLDEPEVLGLSELMNVPGVLLGDEEVYKKLAMKEGLHVDGHAPGLLGNDLMAYRAAGVTSDHECVTKQEALERLRAGMYLQIREGSAAHNLEALASVVDEKTAPYCMLVTDDRHAADLLREGHMNYVASKALRQQIPLSLVLNMATINTARYFGLKEVGMIAPHYRADILLDDGAGNPVPYAVYKDGVLVAKKGQLVVDLPPQPQLFTGKINYAPLTKESLRVPAIGGKFHIIGLVPGQIITDHLTISANGREFIEPDPDKDLVKLAVIERHKATGNVGTALLKGFGLKHGAIASTVAHDSHNLVIAGVNDEDMLLAAEEIKRIGGGFTIVADGKVLASLPLPIGGLMADLPAAEIAAKHEELTKLSHELGVWPEHSPFSLVFLSLPVIPSLKLTDKGLVDVDKFCLIK